MRPGPQKIPAAARRLRAAKGACRRTADKTYLTALTDSTVPPKKRGGARAGSAASRKNAAARGAGSPAPRALLARQPRAPRPPTRRAEETYLTAVTL